jgi:3-dehydroquinate dehydratase/shikimate dehydrogenase
VLAAKSGALLTYASVGVGAETAPGQPTIDDLLGRYRFEKIGPATAVYGVIGWPVAHSLGPVIHNAGFGKIGYDGVYLPMPIPPEYEHFKATVGSLVDHGTLQFRGASVTTPHKENLVRFVEERGGKVCETAGRLGAANTLVVGNGGKVECTNTDAPVILGSLCGAMDIDPAGLRDVSVAVLGAGGVARAVVGALADAGANVVIFNRTRGRAELLADRFRDHRDVAGRPVRVLVSGLDSIADGNFRIFVNCTSVGMTGGPAPDASPLTSAVTLDESAVVFDTVYAPPRTPLLRQAEAAGAQTIGGLDMFLRQAALQFLVWTGCEAPSDVFRESIAGRRPG